MNGQNSDFKDAFEAGKEAAAKEAVVTTVQIGDRLYAVVPTGKSVQSFEAHAQTPTSKRGAVQVFDVESFVDYVNQHKTPHTRIFADGQGDGLPIVAVLDHHAEDAPGWGRHRITLSARTTQEWDDWTEIDGTGKNQVEFAEFIENHLQDIASPTGAAVLEMVKTLEVKRGVNFSSAIRLDNGQTQLLYDETIQGSAQKGSVQIPDQFVLGLKPFEGADSYRVTARFRYRLSHGSVSLWVDLIQPEKVLDAAFTERVAQVKAGTELVVLNGLAPAEAKPLA